MIRTVGELIEALERIAYSEGLSFFVSGNGFDNVVENVRFDELRREVVIELDG